MKLIVTVLFAFSAATFAGNSKVVKTLGSKLYISVGSCSPESGAGSPYSSLPITYCQKFTVYQAQKVEGTGIWNSKWIKVEGTEKLDYELVTDTRRFRGDFLGGLLQCEDYRRVVRENINVTKGVTPCTK